MKYLVPGDDIAIRLPESGSTPVTTYRLDSGVLIFINIAYCMSALFADINLALPHLT